jgi:hypothetical protein
MKSGELVQSTLYASMESAQRTPLVILMYANKKLKKAVGVV